MNQTFKYYVVFEFQNNSYRGTGAMYLKLKKPLITEDMITKAREYIEQEYNKQYDEKDTKVIILNWKGLDE